MKRLSLAILFFALALPAVAQAEEPEPQSPDFTVYTTPNKNVTNISYGCEEGVCIDQGARYTYKLEPYVRSQPWMGEGVTTTLEVRGNCSRCNQAFPINWHHPVNVSAYEYEVAGDEITADEGKVLVVWQEEEVELLIHASFRAPGYYPVTIKEVIEPTEEPWMRFEYPFLARGTPY